MSDQSDNHSDLQVMDKPVSVSSLFSSLIHFTTLFTSSYRPRVTLYHILK